MRVLTVVHQRNAGAGVFGEAAAAAGHELVEWLPFEDASPPRDGFEAAMVFGGAMHVDQRDANPWLAEEHAFLVELIERGVPMLGVCLGAQLLSEAVGGSPQRAAQPEIGWHRIDLTAEGEDDPLLAPLPASFEGFSWHSYETSPPAEAVPLATSDICLQAFRVGDRTWGIQFHAEVTGEIVRSWIADYDSDDDARRIRVDPDALRAESDRRMAAWNELGRGISERFLREAEAITPG